MTLTEAAEATAFFALMTGGAGLYGYVLEHGEPFEFGRVSSTMGPPKACFNNAGIQALASTDLLYCEGFATTDAVPNLPIHHAWLIGPDGRVVEPTWERGGRSYFGVVFDPRCHARAVAASGHWDLLDDLARRQAR